MSIESRGRDATGFAWAEKKEPDHVFYSKAEGKATRVAPTLPLPKKGIRTLLGHTRYLTLGGADNNDNNHPVVSEHITCVHNGRIENHHDLIELTGLDRVGEVDSWSIPALLSQQEQLGAKHPTELLELIEGVAAIAWLDATEHGVLHLARLSTRPLTIGFTKRGDLLFSSTPRSMRMAAALSKVSVVDVTEIAEGTYLRVANSGIAEWRTFKVNHPKVEQLTFDTPGKKKKKKKKRKTTTLPASGVTSYDPPMSYDEWLERKGDAEFLDNLDGFEPWEESLGDGIDWDSLAPRRGWENWPAAELERRNPTGALDTNNFMWDDPTA